MLRTDTNQVNKLLNINTATADQLQTLKAIGPVKADRIVRYREQVAPLYHQSQLAEAAGISIEQAVSLAPQIEWDHQEPRGFDRLLLALILITFWSVALYYLSEINTLGHRPVEVLYNLAVILIVVGVCVWPTILLAGASGHKFVFTTVALALIVPGLISLLCTYGLIQLTRQPQDFTELVQSAGIFGLTASAIAGLTLGPAAHVRWQFRVDRQALTHIEKMARYYDLLMLALPLLTLMLIDLDQPGFRLFTFWAGIWFVVNGAALKQGNSTYLTSLSALQTARIKWRYDGRYLWNKYSRFRSLGAIWLTGNGLVQLCLGIYYWID